jgi:MFS family permease
MQTVVLGWQMYLLTKEPLCIGLIGLAEAIPALGLALYAGLLVDRGEPQRIFTKMLLVSLCSAAFMLLGFLDLAPFSIGANITSLYLSAFTAGLARAFSAPAVYALVPRIVPREQLPQSTASMSIALQTARIFGPACGGLLCGMIGGFGTTWIVCGVLLLAMIASSHPLQLRPVDRAPQPIESPLTAMWSGVRFVFKHPILLPALSLDMISVLFAGVTALLPIYAAEILHVGPSGFGMLRTAPALGAALVAVVLARYPIGARAGVYLLGSVVGFGFAILIFAVSTHFELSLMMLAISGAFDGVSVVIRSSAVQLNSPEEMRGRIAAVNSIFIGSSNELGEVESGVLAHLIGVIPTAVFGACACLLTAIAVTILCPTLRRMDLNDVNPS